MAYYQFNDGQVAELRDELDYATKITKKAFDAARQRLACEEILTILSPGSNLHTIRANDAGTKHRVVAPVTDSAGKPAVRDITHLVALAAGFRRDRDGVAIVQGGGGYSKSFQICYSLGRALWPNGTPEPHGTRNGEPDRDGGYALKHWAL